MSTDILKQHLELVKTSLITNKVNDKKSAIAKKVKKKNKVKHLDYMQEARQDRQNQTLKLSQVISTLKETSKLKVYTGTGMKKLLSDLNSKQKRF